MRPPLDNASSSGWGTTTTVRRAGRCSAGADRRRRSHARRRSGSPADGRLDVARRSFDGSAIRRHRRCRLVMVVVVVEVGHQDPAIAHRVQSLLARTVVSIPGGADTPSGGPETCVSAPTFGHSNSSGRGRSPRQRDRGLRKPHNPRRGRRGVRSSTRTGQRFPPGGGPRLRRREMLTERPTLRPTLRPKQLAGASSAASLPSQLGRRLPGRRHRAAPRRR